MLKVFQAALITLLRSNNGVNKMRLLNEKQENALKFQPAWYTVHAILYDEANKELTRMAHACFAQLKYQPISTYAPKSKYLDIFFPDLLTPQLLEVKPSHRGSCARFFAKMLMSTEMSRHVVKWKIISKEEMLALKVGRSCGSRSDEDFKYTQGIMIRFDTTKASAKEIFYVGSFFRYIAEGTSYVYNFFKLHKELPEKPIWEKLYIAHNVYMWKGFKGVQGHSVMSSGFKYILRSPKEYLELLDKASAPFIKDTNFSFGGNEIHYVVQGNDYYKYKYCPKLYDSFLNKENCDKFGVQRVRYDKFPQGGW